MSKGEHLLEKSMTDNNQIMMTFMMQSGNTACKLAFIDSCSECSPIDIVSKSMTLLLD